MSIKTFLSGVGSYLMGVGVLLLSLLWIKGIVHSIKKHGDIDNAASFFPLWGAYRGLESYWHKDEETKIDWDKRIPNDIETALQLIGASEDIQYTTSVNDQIEKFSTKISKYPNDKFNKIKGAASNYIKYNWYATSDLIESYKRMSKGGKAEYSESKEQISSYDSLLNYYGMTEIKILKQGIDSAVLTMKTEDYDQSELGEAINKMNLMLTARMESMKNAFNRIFSQNFSL